MLTRDMFFTDANGVVAMDFATLRGLSEADYRSYVRDHLLLLDHHDCLRFGPTGSGLALNQSQLDILVEEISALRPQLEADSSV